MIWFCWYWNNCWLPVHLCLCVCIRAQPLCSSDIHLFLHSLQKWVYLLMTSCTKWLKYWYSVSAMWRWTLLLLYYICPVLLSTARLAVSNYLSLLSYNYMHVTALCVHSYDLIYAFYHHHTCTELAAGCLCVILCYTTLLLHTQYYYY